MDRNFFILVCPSYYMDKDIKVSYTEQSKAVTTSVSIDYYGSKEEIPSNEDILIETQKLFEEAQRYSTRKTMEKR